jgi:hypothetical protein
MANFDVPVAGFATNIRTINDLGSEGALPEPPIASRSGRPHRSDRPSALRGRASVGVLQQQRLWWLASVIPVLCGANAISLHVMGAGGVVQRLFVSGMIVASGAALWMGWMARTRRTSVAAAMIAWLIISTGVCSAIFYLGAFSPALMIAVFAVFFVAARDELVVALSVYFTLAVFHATLVGVVIGGGLPDPGVLRFAETDLGKLAVTEVFLQVVLLATLIGGCAIRHSTARTVRDVEQQARLDGHHELLLEDARRAFEASLRAAGGGWFSHQTMGAYRLGRLLGEGSMGEVYEAIDTRSGAEAAVKLLRREVLGNRRIVQRFLTEARIVTSLPTDHIVRVLETADAGTGLPYIAMERLYGHDLWKHMKDHDNAGLPPAEVDDLLRQIARGIDAAHRAGVVHRDLNPSNLFREDKGTWKILDFGVSKVLGDRTADDAIVGTPNFMSPEQVKGGTVDGRSDIFALGAIVYYAITGKLAFQGETLAAIAFEVTHHAPPPPTALVPGLDPELGRGLGPDLDEVIMTALAKQPQQRFATATAFAEAFSRALGARRQAVGPTAR